MRGLARPSTAAWGLALAAAASIASSCGRGATSNAGTPAPVTDESKSAPPTRDARPHTDEVRLRHDGKARRAVVYVPGSAGPNAPVVLAFHGGGGSADGTRQAYGLEPVADREGFVVVYPEGLGKKFLGKTFAVWGVDALVERRPETKADEVGFVAALLDRLGRDYDIDPKRVYAVGLSNGSMMALTLACELSDRIAAVAGTGATLQGADCSSARAVPTLYVAGRKDPCWPHDGGACAGCWQKAMKEVGLRRKPPEVSTCGSVATFEAGWAAHLGCRGTPTAVPHDGPVQCRQYDRCADDAVFRLCSVDDLGHVWPGGGYGGCDRNPDGRFCRAYINAVGPRSDALDLSEEGWRWLSGHALP